MKNSLSLLLKKIVKCAEKCKIKVVFIGGIAISYFSIPRATYDIDGIVSWEDKKMKEFIKALKKEGFKREQIKNLKDFLFITFYHPRYRIYVDFFLATSEFQKTILRRAKKVKIDKTDLSIASCEDLILLKLLVQREKDLEDVRELIKENKESLDFLYLNKWAKLLGVEFFLKDEIRSLNLKNKRKGER
ncbi:MAG: nucleotidyltransferase [Candidatus Omnitrophica bacterium]|nr:nucleotidyltransferase [Candidatus Omnitrophota bacterium]